MSENNLPFTVRDYSNRQLDHTTELWRYGNIPIVTIIHEVRSFACAKKSMSTVLTQPVVVSCQLSLRAELQGPDR
jgi:anti-sigma-K factor RskA